MYPRVDVGTWSGFAPRAGVAVDLFGNGKTVAKATYGLFNHSEFENYVNPITFATLFNKNSVSEYSYRWRDQDGNDDYTPGEVNLDINGSDFITVSGPANNACHSARSRVRNLDIATGSVSGSQPTRT